ncbi:sensor histidine kinase [Defluviitalea phaphyphila]|uniref:sensor histidine kinase n=1 Tax=Defluviitalea phaphyphila TaxID=1473580 RepID=UPI00072FD890|nr:HAMP domain-containing sensor histidine kinase [Defluviitalea phaphyphila]
MDIKLKNKSSKIILGIIFLLLFSYGLGTLRDSLGQFHFRLKGSYFKTEEFAEDIEDFIDLFEYIYLDYGDIDKVKENMEVDYNDIENLKEQYETTMNEEISSVKLEYENRIVEATNNNAVAYVEELLRERDKKIEEIKKQYTKTKEELVEEIKNKKIDELQNEIQNVKSRFLYKQDYIKYYIVESNGKKYSNLSDDIQDINILKESSLYIQEFPYHTKLKDNMTSVNRFFITRNLQGFIAIPKDKHSLIVENFYDYKEEATMFLIYFLISIFTFITAVIIGIKYRKDILKTVDPLKKYYDRLPIDIRLFSVLLMLFLSSQIGITFFDINIKYLSIKIQKLMVYTILLGILIVQIYFLIPVFKSLDEFKLQWKDSIFCRIKKSLEKSFIFKSAVFKILFIMGSIFVLGVGAVVILFGIELIVLYIPIALILGGGILYYVFSKLGYFNQILKFSEDILLGNNNANINLKGRGLLSNLAENINKLKAGMDKSRMSEIKSERLKTELISNVSHDLRTPLTSIINYTEFLKDENITEDKKKEYIEIIEKKSKRLKVLIDDLFEVSKMATGNIELKKEKADIVLLINQALAEYDEKIKESLLDFKVSSSSSHIYAVVDGRKMWRVFENIINNILKYSMDNTRVYINIEQKNNEVVISFKNISKYELGENVEEFLERFKRGDKSRNTEGSGLGLAIAKSIVDNHGGNLDIKIDGDLFKTIIVVPRGL